VEIGKIGIGSWKVEIGKIGIGSWKVEIGKIGKWEVGSGVFLNPLYGPRFLTS